MPKPKHTNERLSLGRRTKVISRTDFEKLRKWFPDRLNIFSEGDSWFAYPPKWIVAGKPSNLIAHISGWTKKKANFYTMASNGDEAVDMVSGKQKHELVKILKWHSDKTNMKPVDILLFSGGGNDVVGENDFERFLKPYKPGNTAKDCVNISRLDRKVKQIGLAVEELLDIRDHYSPNTIIITHTYDYPYASTTGGRFLGGLIKTKAWMKRFMDKEDINIPDNLQCDVIKCFMDALGDSLLSIENNRSGIIVVDTRKTLNNRKDWLNEIHPTSAGFKLIAEKIYKKMKQEFPVL